MLHKLFSLTITFCLWQKLVYLKENRTETSFCDGNLFSEGNFFSDRNFFRTETCFCDINFFLWQKFDSVTASFSVIPTCFCDRNLPCKKNTFFEGILCMISRGKFPLEMGVSVISDNQNNHFVEPWADGIRQFCLVSFPPFLSHRCLDMEIMFMGLFRRV